jgi:hypothetical protein
MTAHATIAQWGSPRTAMTAHATIAQWHPEHERWEPIGVPLP